MENKIPIKNIYYMLCYAWDRLEQKDIVEVDTIGSNEMLDLFVMVLISGISYLIKRGFHRQYIPYRGEENFIRGKININESIKRKSWIKGKMYCEYDDLSHNVLHNQILKTTINNLILYPSLNEELKDQLIKLYKYFQHIDKISLNKKMFREVQINRNNHYYSFLLDICEIIYNNLLIDESLGEVKFRDFDRNERQMAYLFENFVRNFYKKELKEAKVYRENIEWNVDEGKDLEYLPIMQTDISIEKDNKKIIMDTKYYKDTLAQNFNTKKLHSENLYQLFAYLKNVKKKGNINKDCEGILLYPKIGEKLDLTYKLQGEVMKIKTVDLNQDWQLIHDRLLEVVG